MATIPLSGTNIRLLSDIPFTNDYKHTRWFDSSSDQLAYFNARNVVYSISQMNFQRIEGYNFIAVPESIDNLWNTNYIMFQNASYNNKWFFAFVTKLEYKQRNNTLVHFQIDTLQTWMFDLTFHPSFVVREHCKLWNSDGSPVLNTVDEGIHYGTEYDNVYHNEILPTGYKWMVILAKNPLHNGADQSKIVPTVVGTPQPLTTYILPFSDDDTVPAVVDTTGNGVLVSKPSDVLTGLYSFTNAVTDIVSIYVTDFTGIPSTTSSGTVTITNTNGNQVIGAQIVNPDISGGFFNCLYVEKVLNFDTIEITESAKYDGYKTVTESKLLMFPYTQLVLDDFKGNRVQFKNEYINNSNLKILAKGSLGVSNKTSYGIQDYNFTDSNTFFKSFVSDENALINSDPNDIPIVTELLAAYLQGHKNSIGMQKAQIYANTGLNYIGSALHGNLLGVASAVTHGIQGIDSIMAKQKDIENMPASISKMGSNSSYSIGNNYNGVFIIKKQIKDEYISKLTDYFNMFGYKLNDVKIPNFHTRQNWNYVQTKACNIVGSLNNDDLQDVKNIFDNGITLWHTDDMMNYSLSNGVI